MTKALTRSGLAAALSMVLLFTAAALPSGKLALIALSGMVTAFLRISCGLRWAAGCFLTVSILSALLLPQKTIGILYALFFGYYPFIKPSLERTGTPVLRWLRKLAVFWTALAAACLLASLLLTGARPPLLWLIPLFLGGGAVFALYDAVLTRWILYYLRRIAGKLNGGS